MTKWHHASTLAGNPNGRIHYDIGGDDNSNVCLVYPSEDGDADTLHKAQLIADAPKTAVERDKLKESNAYLVAALQASNQEIKLNLSSVHGSAETIEALHHKCLEIRQIEKIIADNETAIRKAEGGSDE